ncbi:hypothetical protein KAT72_07350 [Aeromonas popoffii]|uniref:Uncharacterized protein n=1 Tax=Aeromonas popoffii TaxID=70856 RepID=A0ABS5GNY4_9GAMM|nr:hypothetical protein [Aeromonas popoffii]MBR7628853.1 hypothetical protein [Aeromonas popoffii]
MIVDSAYSDELFKLQATADRLEAEWEAIKLQPHASSEEVYAKANEFTQAYNALQDFALKGVSASC